MEELQMPAVFLARDATMACYACGRTTGTVVDIGYSGTTVTPVYEGYVEQKGIRRSPMGSLSMDEEIVKILDQLNVISKPPQQSQQFMPLYQIRKPDHTLRGESFHKLARLHVAQQAREEGAGAAVDTTATAAAFATPRVPFHMPDGQIIHIPPEQRFAVANLVLGAEIGPTAAAASNNSSSDGGMIVDATMAMSTPTPTNENNNNPSSVTSEYVRRREERYAAHQKQLSNYISTALSAPEGDDDDEDDEENDDGNNKNNKKKKEKELYTEETAVGISSRRTRSTRGTRANKAQEAAARKKKQKQQEQEEEEQQQLQQQQQQEEEMKNKRRQSFSNRLLQKACVPYLQTHLEQQLTSMPLANMVCDSAFRCDRDQQASLLGNVILGGGGACLGPNDQSVPEQLRMQVEAIIHTHTPGWRVKVLSPSIQERSICSWLGGSILASLGTFHEMWITKAEYEEWGPAIVNRKCP